MVVSQARLAEILLYSLVLGMFFGAFYDLFRVRRNNFSLAKRGKSDERFYSFFEHLMVFAEDVLFWFTCGCVSCVFIFYFNSGRFRYVAILGGVVGFYIYYKTVGKLVLRFSGLIIGFIKKALLIVLRCTVVPVAKLVGLCLKITVGRLALSAYTHLSTWGALVSADKGFGILNFKGKIRDEKTFKYFCKGGCGGIHTVLRRNHHTDAV